MNVKAAPIEGGGGGGSPLPPPGAMRPDLQPRLMLWNAMCPFSHSKLQDCSSDSGDKAFQSPVQDLDDIDTNIPGWAPF